MTHDRACAGVGAKTVNTPRTTTPVPIAHAIFFISPSRFEWIVLVQALPSPHRDRMSQRHRPLAHRGLWPRVTPPVSVTCRLA
jgi:hypothetical protein